MKHTITHEIVTTNPATGVTEVTRHVFSDPSGRAWPDEHARAVMKPFVELLVAKGYDVKVVTK